MPITPAPYKRQTAKSIRKRRESFGFSAEAMAKLCGASSGRVVRKWEAGDNAVPEGVSRFIWLLDHLSPADRTRIVDHVLDGGR